MAISDAEKSWFERARRRLAASKLDDLATESTLTALAKAEANLDQAPPEMRGMADAVAALAIAFSHFAAHADEASRRTAEKAVAKHAEDCAAAMKAAGGNFVTQAKRSLLSCPLAVAIVASTALVVFRDPIASMIFR